MNIKTTGFLLLTAGFVLPGQAAQFDLGPIAGQVDNQVSLGLGVRLEDQNPGIIARANRTADGQQGQAFSTNGDDGNLAFEKGDLISANAKLTSTMYLNWRNWGAQFRGSANYDAVLADHDFFDPEDYAGPPGRLAGPADLERRRDRIQERLGRDADLLDAFIFTDFEIFDRYLTLRVGQQVLNWGESTLVLNGLNSIVAADASAARVPGVDLSEVFIPAGMATMQYQLTADISIEGFYQYDWVNTEPDPAGSYFSTNDFATFGGETAEVGFGRCPELSAPGRCAAAAGGSAIPRGPDRHPDDGGQGGVSIRSFIPAFGGVDAAIYAANYHSRLPLVSGAAVPLGLEGVAPAGNYFVEYPEDIKLYGLSFNSVLPFGGVAIQGEYSLKVDQPLQLEDVDVLLAGLRTPLPSQVGPFEPGEPIQGFRRFDVSQVDVSFSKILGPQPALGVDQVLLLLELAGSQIHDFPDPSEQRFEGPGTYLPGDPVVSAGVGLVDENGRPMVQTDGYPDDLSWGYRLAGRVTYNNVFDRFTIEPAMIWLHDVDGTSATPILNFVEGRKELRLSVTGSYLDVWRLRLGYTRYGGAGNFNLVNDRDYASLSMSYSF